MCTNLTCLSSKEAKSCKNMQNNQQLGYSCEKPQTDGHKKQSNNLKNIAEKLNNALADVEACNLCSKSLDGNLKYTILKIKNIIEVCATRNEVRSAEENTQMKASAQFPVSFPVPHIELPTDKNKSESPIVSFKPLRQDSVRSTPQFIQLRNPKNLSTGEKTSMQDVDKKWLIELAPPK